MSYNVSRKVSPDLALCSASSVASGYVDFAFVAGSFTPTISGATLTLEAGFEYYITTCLAITVDASASYFTEIDGVAGTSYYLAAVTVDSGKDEQWDSILSQTNTAFKVNCNQSVSSNSRIIIWRFPL